MQIRMVFDENARRRPGFRTACVEVLVDPISAQYLRGTVVDFSDALTAGGFKITNPNAGKAGLWKIFYG